MLRIIPRDNITLKNTSQNAVNTLGLNTSSGYLPSMFEREMKARNSKISTSKQQELQVVGIGQRGLLDQTRVSQGMFIPPMIQDKEELVKMYTRGASGLASNPNLSNERVNIGTQIMSKSQPVFSGRLY